MNELDDHQLVKKVEKAIGEHFPNLSYGEIKIISGFVLVFCSCPSVDIRSFMIEEIKKMMRGAKEISEGNSKEIQDKLDQLKKKDIVN